MKSIINNKHIALIVYDSIDKKYFNESIIDDFEKNQHIHCDRQYIDLNIKSLNINIKLQSLIWDSPTLIIPSSEILFCTEIITPIIDLKLNFICCELPNLSYYSIKLLVLLAKYESTMCSTTSAMGVKHSAKKGIKSGMANPNYKGNKVDILKEANKASIKANKLKAENNENNKQFISICSLMNITANSDFKEIANELNRRGCRTSTGKEFNNVNARNMWSRYSVEIRDYKNSIDSNE